MPRYKVIIEYDGSNFHGWQRQGGIPSIQAAIEDAIMAFCGEEVQIHTAGRTDSGVHATGQASHFDLSTAQDPFKILSAVNHHLKPLPVALLSVDEVDNEFHARFSAKRRHYIYRIS